MTLTKPPGIKPDLFKSAKWDGLAEGRRFAQSYSPASFLLCQWHKIVDPAIEELDNFGSQITENRTKPESRPRAFAVNCKEKDEIHAYPKRDSGCEPDDI